MSKVKNFEIVTQLSYLSEADLIKALNKIDAETKKNHIQDYAYILHDKDVHKDGTKKEAHWHILIRMDNSYDFSYIAKRFNVPENFVNGIRFRFANALCYLTHDTEQAKLENKYQYDDTAVKSNFGWKSEAQKAITNQDYKKRKKEILTLIDNGEIRRYNISDYISITEYDKYKSSIESAFRFREDRLARATSRDMKCIFIQGDSQLGKTTYAKLWCKKQNIEFYCSSGSNDPLDNYAGQPAIILDELRPSTYNLSDLLKLLDNNTASSVKSRYRNKVLECKYIIITTTLDINSFFNHVFKEQQETVVQLKRRCEYYMKVEEKTIQIHRYDKKSKDYKLEQTIDNPVPAAIAKAQASQSEAVDLTSTFSLSEDDVMAYINSKNPVAS